MTEENPDTLAPANAPFTSTPVMIEPRACLSVIMPCYNEANTVEQVVARVLSSPWVAELIIVDDGSTDGTREIIRALDSGQVRVFEQPMNLGKGAALRRGFGEASADFVIVQDADLEYDPGDYQQLLEPLIRDQADVVYGSRFLGGRAHRVLYYWHSVGNKFLTTMSNMFTNLNLTDMETCYKVFRREVIQSIEIDEERFGVEPELTAKIAKAGWRVFEVSISYAGRTYAEGKKIGWRDGIRAVYGIVRYSEFADRFTRRAVDRGRGPAGYDESDAELSEALDSLTDADNYADWIAELCDPHLGKDVLEVGAGHGELTRRFAADHSVTAVDVSERCVRLLQSQLADLPNVKVMHSDVASLEMAEQFDSAVLVNVLEHIDDDLAALQTLHRVLRPGGRLIVYAPAFDGLYSEFDRRVGHYRRYRIGQIVDLADRAGYRIVDARYVGSVGAVIWWAYAKHLRRTPTKRRPARLYDRLVVPLLRRAEEGRRPPVGQSVLLVAERAD